MLASPMIPVLCSRCEEYEQDFGMTPLARGSWDCRNLEHEIEAAGWRWVSKDEHICPNCVEDEEEEPA